MDYLANQSIGIAYGSLASGADIVIAEEVLSRSGELNIVLPFDTDEFEQVSVRPGGERWVERFQKCLSEASAVVLACDSAYMGDDSLFSYASEIAMGHARNRAATLGVEATQLAVWDGAPARGVGGTADAVETWRAAGGHVHVVRSHPTSAKRVRQEDPVPDRERSVQAILFADMRGFSRLRDEHYPSMINSVFEPLAAVIRRHGDSVLSVNSWGDAVQAVFTDVVSAGRCALELQDVNGRIDRNALALPGDLDLRIGLHVGPIFQLRDPFKASAGWWGREITRAARIEPRTPEGEVYATDAFAALLSLEPGSGLLPEYVGRVTTAKDFETIPMYRLRQIGPDAAARREPRVAVRWDRD